MISMSAFYNRAPSYIFINESVNPLQDARLSVANLTFSFYILIPAVHRPNDLIDRGSYRTRTIKQNKLTLNNLST